MSRVDGTNGAVFIQNNESPYERKEECPVRITSVFGYDEELVKDAAEKLMQDFNWKFHSFATLQTITRKVTSIILWNTKP